MPVQRFPLFAVSFVYVPINLFSYLGKLRQIQNFIFKFEHHWSYEKFAQCRGEHHAQLRVRHVPVGISYLIMQWEIDHAAYDSCNDATCSWFESMTTCTELHALY